MVAGKHTTWQQEILFSVTKTGLATEKYFSEGLQSIMLSIMMWMKEEQKLHINVLKLLAVKLALLTITKGETLHSQIHSKTELSENWRNWQLYIDKGQQRDLGNFNVQRDHSYRTVLAKFSVSERGLAVQAQYLLEWQLSTQIFNKVNQVLGQRRKHLFTSRQLNLMKTGSTKKKEKCNETRLAISGKSPSVCIYLVFLYPSITGKGCAQQNSEHVLIMPAWDIQPWYPEILDFLTSFQILSRKRQCFKLILEGRVFLQQPTTPSPYWLGKFTQLSQLSPMHESQRLIQITI